MRPLVRFGVLCLVLLCGSARAQEGLGLDLSDEPKTEEKEAAPSAPAPETPPPAPEPAPAAEAAPGAPAKLTELDIAAGDRIKSVQRKPFLKRGRFELAPLAFLTLNDALYPKFGPGARAAFHLQDNFAIGARFLQYNLIPNNNVRLAKRQLKSRLPSVMPKSSFSADLLWSPIYGKVALFNSIRHFDLYVIGGPDAFLTQTSDEDGLHFGAHIGVGQRFSVSDFMTVDLALIDTLYTDRPGGGRKSLVQHVLGLNAGVSFFLPLHFDYREN